MYVCMDDVGLFWKHNVRQRAELTDQMERKIIEGSEWSHEPDFAMNDIEKNSMDDEEDPA